MAEVNIGFIGFGLKDDFSATFYVLKKLRR